MARPAKQATEQAAEITADAARLAGFPHPRETRRLFGQDTAQKVLRAALQSGRLHHAWLLSGPEGVGKATLAYDFARHLFTTSPTGEQGRGEQGRNTANPLLFANLLPLTRPYNDKSKKFAQNIPVAEIRRVKDFLGRTAAQSGYRMVLVDRADELNIAAANGLLKALEEPPPRVVFLLISSEPGRLLPTIRSRCRQLACPPLEAEALHAAVTQACAAADVTLPEGGALDRVLTLAAGRVRRALELIDGDGHRLIAHLLAIFAALPGLDFRQVHALADEITGVGAEPRFELAFSLLLDFIRRLVRQAAHPETFPSPLDELAQAARRLKTPTGLAQWAELWDTLEREKSQTLALNLDRKNFLLICFDQLRAVATRTMVAGS